jgi:hypothetical protein
VAGDIPPLNVEILVQLSNLTAAVQEATAGLNKIGDTAKNQESKFSSLKTTMLGVFAGNVMTEGLSLLTQGLHSAIQAVQDTQVATESLSTSMNNAKVNTAANRTEIQATTEKMSALGFSTAESENAYNKLITATGSVTESTNLMSMAADLARYKHEDLATAAGTLEKATMGNAKAFKEFGITLDTTLPKNQAIAKAMDELNGKIGGQAIGYTHTFSGEMEVLKAKFDDVAVKVGAVVMPILTKLMEFITGVIIPGIEFLYNNTIGAWIRALVDLWNTHEGLRKAVVDVITVIIDALGYLVGAIAKVVDAASHLPIIGKMFKGIGSGIDEAAAKIGDFSKSLDNLANKQININGASLADQLGTAGTTGAGGDAGVTGGLGATGNVSKAATATEKALTARNAKIKTYNDQAVTLEDQMNQALADRQTKMDAAAATRDQTVTDAQAKFSQDSADIQSKYQDAMQTAQDNYNTTVENLQTTHEQNLINIQQTYADKATALQQTAATDRAKIIQDSINVMTNAFASATQINLGTLFTASDGTANDLAVKMQAQLDSINQLQNDAGQLAAAGYNQSFINQVVSQGPAQGDALAQSVLQATPATQDSIKTLYSKIEDTSQNGLNDLAAQMNDGTNFATQALAQQYAQVGVTLTTQLAANSAAMQDAITKENDSFNNAMDTAQDALNKATQAATDARDLALQKANQTLSDSLNAAQDAFNKSTQAISDASMKQLDALQQKLADTQAQIEALGASTASISNYEASVLAPAGVSTNNGAGSFMNTAGYNAGSSPVIGNLTQNVYTTDPSLPSVTTGTLNAITLGQTQGIIPGGGKTMVAS